MEKMRKSFQGVWNIIRFNWHFYVFAFAAISALLVGSVWLSESIRFYLYLFMALASASILLSLLVSYYIYDRSGLYELKWIEDPSSEQLILNINAGFDETSHLLKAKFKKAELIALDFYDPLKHTEVSIKRARKAYPVFPGTKQIKTNRLPLEDNSTDKVFLILAAHEIRNEEERIAFFIELKRILKSNGQIIVTEHLRDLNNFLAYNIGFFHFHSKPTWQRTFNEAELKITKEIKLTPFISTFILEANGNSI